MRRSPTTESIKPIQIIEPENNQPKTVQSTLEAKRETKRVTKGEDELALK
jgi:hypothetical protein